MTLTKTVSYRILDDINKKMTTAVVEDKLI